MNIDKYIVISSKVLHKSTLESINKTLAKLVWEKAPTFGGAKNYRTCSKFPITEVIRDIKPYQWKNEQQKIELQKLDETIYQAIGLAAKEYQNKFKELYYKNDTGFDILRYKKGQFYKYHIDHCEEYPRSLAISLALNDNYKGGEFKLLNKLKIKVPAGHALMFPANFMFPHEILKIKSGTRYSVITWFK